MHYFRENRILEGFFTFIKLYKQLGFNDLNLIIKKCLNIDLNIQTNKYKF